ncbi:hypothetical protein WJX81_002719 [Elliptochloris bilobata]|uniref:Serine/threonine-protein kinase ATR n=1 Tax=Elliptochloris bilobata TaxID=381761 RepID=A0AAW1S9N4_9CHLO
MGVCDVDGYMVFCARALPGERLRARIRSVRSRYAVATKVETVRPALDAVVPRCEHFAECGGCNIQDLSYAAQLMQKQQEVPQTIRRIAGLDTTAVMRPIIGCDDPWRYRNKMKFHYKKGILGMHHWTGKAGVGPIRDCHLQDEGANVILRLTADALQGEAFSSLAAVLDGLTIRRGTGDSGQPTYMAILSTQALPSAHAWASARLLAQQLAEGAPGLASVVVAPRDSVLTVLWGAPHIMERVEPSGLEFLVSPMSFRQTNPRQGQVLLRLVAEAAGLRSGDKLVDLYCGSGAMALGLAREFLHANLDANAGVAALAREAPHADVVVADPARRGLSAPLRSWLQTCGARTIIYVSCHPAAQARDLLLLSRFYGIITTPVKLVWQVLLLSLRVLWLVVVFLALGPAQRCVERMLWHGRRWLRRSCPDLVAASRAPPLAPLASSLRSHDAGGQRRERVHFRPVPVVTSQRQTEDDSFARGVEAAGVCLVTVAWLVMLCEAVTTRLCSVLVALLQKCISVERVKERELLSVVKLVNMALQRHPDAFSDGACAAPLRLLRQLWPLFANESLRAVHSALLETISALTTLTAKANRAVFLALVAGVYDILADLHQLLRCLCTPGALPTGAAAELACFGTAFSAGAAAQASSSPPSARAQDRPAAPTAEAHGPARVRLDSLAQCKLLAAAALGLLAHCAREAPASAAALAPHEALAAVAGLAACGALDLQAAALSTAERLMAAAATNTGAAHVVADAALGVLAAWAAAADDDAVAALVPCLRALAANLPAEALDRSAARGLGASGQADGHSDGPAPKRRRLDNRAGGAQALQPAPAARCSPSPIPDADPAACELAVEALAAAAAQLAPDAAPQDGDSGHAQGAAERLRMLAALAVGLGHTSPALLAALAAAAAAWAVQALAPLEPAELHGEHGTCQTGLVLGTLSAVLSAAVEAAQRAALGAPAAAAAAADAARRLLQLAASALGLGEGGGDANPNPNPSRGQPFAKGTPAARAADDADPRARAAAAVVAAGFPAAAQRAAAKAGSLAAALLTRLAADGDAGVRAAVAAGASALVGALAERADRLGALRRTCQAVQACLPMGCRGSQAWWGGTGAWDGVDSGVLSGVPGPAGPGGAAAPGVCVAAEDMTALCSRLLTDEPEPPVQEAMAKALLRWVRLAPAVQLPDARLLLAWASTSVGAHAQPAVRALAGAFAAEAMRPAVLRAAWADPPAGRGAVADTGEVKVLQELRAVLNGERSREGRAALLVAVAGAGAAAVTDSGALLARVLLLQHLTDGSACHRATAAQLLTGMADAKGVELDELLLGEPRVAEYLGRNLVSRPSLVGEVAELLEVGERALALRILPAALPRLVELEQRAEIAALAAAIGATVQQMCRERVHHIVAKVMFEGTDNFEALMAFIESLIEESFLHVLGMNQRNVITDIFAQASAAAQWRVGAKLPPWVAERARTVVRELFQVSAASQPNAQPGAAGMDVAEHLAATDLVTRILKEYGDFLDREQPSEERPKLPQAVAQKQLHIMRSVMLLIELTGAYVGRFAPQMMVLLSSAVRARGAEDLRLAALEGWRMLVAAMAAQAPAQLGQVVFQVVVVLQEALQEDGAITAAAARAVEELVVVNRALLRPVLKRLPPLPPGVDALAKANAVLKEERGSLALDDQVSLLLQSLASDSAAVRATALQELRECLHRPAGRSWLSGLWAAKSASVRQAGQPEQAALLSALLAALLKCLQTQEDAVALASGQAQEGGAGASRAAQAGAECLGLVGAVDPACVGVRLALLEEPQLDDGSLLVALATHHVARVLRTASTQQALDAATYAFQELMSHYGDAAAMFTGAAGTASVSDGACVSSSAGGNTLFAALPAEVQAVARPYLHSQYTITQARPPADGVVFSAGKPLVRWLNQWLRQLIPHAAGPRQHAYRACSFMFRVDFQTSLFLLPYVVQDVLAGSSGEAARVAREIEAVLEAGHASREGALCVQAVFRLLDVLAKWVAEARKDAAGSPSSGGGSSRGRSGGTGEAASPELPMPAARCAELLAALPAELLARAAFCGGAHARALRGFEVHVRAKAGGGGLNPAALRCAPFDHADVSFLQEVYGKLEEPDGLAGLLRLRTGGPRLQDQVLAAEKAGCWSDALALYEQALQNEAPARDLNPNPNPASFAARAAAGPEGQVDGWVAGSAGLAVRQLAALGVAASWRLGRWAPLEGYLALARDSADSDLAGLELGLDAEERWEVRLGRLLAAMHCREGEAVRRQLEEARAELLAPLRAASMESYARAYPHLVRLHMLQEAADAAALAAEGCLGPNERQRRLRWPERLRITQSSLATQEPILALRRQLAVLGNSDADAGECWLQHAQLCRASGHHEAAGMAALEALARGVPGAGLERARLLWARDQQHAAIVRLQEAVQQSAAASGRLTQLSQSSRRSEAEMLLQLACWMAETGQGARAEVSELFERVTALESKAEAGYFEYGRYLDSLMRDARQRQAAKAARARGVPNAAAAQQDRFGGRARLAGLGEDQPYTEILPEVLRCYAKCVLHGHRHVYQALPRMLTILFEHGTYCHASPPPSTNTQEGKREDKARKLVQEIVCEAMRTLPLYVWLVALPQLTSRICHPHEPTQKLTQHILTRVTQAFPHQALWALASVCKSTVASRKDAASTIVSSAKKHHAERGDAGGRIFLQFASLSDQLIRLCHHSTSGREKMKAFSMRREFSALMRMMPTEVLVPTTSSLTLALPASGVPDLAHKPFEDAVTISGIKDEVEVLKSLQAPKKIVLLGSDGREYMFLAKPQDDLRKDSRMMEVAGVINHLFTGQPASRRRNLYLRRFTVMPLTEDCGIIEWVPHTTGLRHCCEAAYIADGIFDRRLTNGVIKKLYDNYPEGKRRAALLEKVLAMLPPRLHRWFLGGWSEPATWHAARLAFARTTAVWSMVGHVVGLGDRHGENILLDAAAGDAVHVDFSVLFDKGLTLALPEVVPFRLTQNMIDGFGVSGHEGVFRRTAEITLQVLRSHRETLVSVLETFVHDPLCEWAQAGTSRRGTEEGTNPMARDALATIEGRLMGTLLGVKSIPSLPLSAEGQAHRLIGEATDKENLGSMYIWWMPWF